MADDMEKNRQQGGQQGQGQQGGQSGQRSIKSSAVALDGPARKSSREKLSA